jgi:Transposase zinc-binding domain
VPDSDEAFGQHVQKETPQELGGGQCHLTLLANAGVILPAERHAFLFEGQQAMIGDSHPVSCGYQTISYNSCRNRHCPKCQAQARERWLAARERELLFVRFTAAALLPSAGIAMLARVVATDSATPAWGRRTQALSC